MHWCKLWIIIRCLNVSGQEIFGKEEITGSNTTWLIDKESNGLVLIASLGDWVDEVSWTKVEKFGCGLILVLKVIWHLCEVIPFEIVPEYTVKQKFILLDDLKYGCLYVDVEIGPWLGVVHFLSRVFVLDLGNK